MIIAYETSMVWSYSQAAIGGWHCLAVDDQGHAYAWGMHT